MHANINGKGNKEICLMAHNKPLICTKDSSYYPAHVHSGTYVNSIILLIILLILSVYIVTLCKRSTMSLIVHKLISILIIL